MPLIATDPHPEVVIIGGGINGLLTAHELARESVRVTVLERRECFSEASWAGGGIVSPLYPWRYSAPVTALAQWAQAYYPGLCDRLRDDTGIDPEYSHCGLLMLAAEDSDAALAWAARFNQSLTRVSPEFVQAREPQVAADLKTPLWMPEVANVRNPRLGAALVKALRANPKVQILEHHEVLGFQRQGDRVVAVDVRHVGQRRTLHGDHWVLCTGAWTAGLTEPLGRSVPVVPVKGQMLLYRPPTQLVQGIVLTSGRYVIPRRDGHLLVGSTLEHSGFDVKVTATAQAQLRAAAAALVPALAHLSPVAQWAGLRPAAPEGIPWIERLPNTMNVFVNAGQYRNGLVLAPASARLVTDLLLARPPIIDPSPYALERTRNLTLTPDPAS